METNRNRGKISGPCETTGPWTCWRCRTWVLFCWQNQCCYCLFVRQTKLRNSVSKTNGQSLKKAFSETFKKLGVKSPRYESFATSWTIQQSYMQHKMTSKQVSASVVPVGLCLPQALCCRLAKLWSEIIKKCWSGEMWTEVFYSCSFGQWEEVLSWEFFSSFLLPFTYSSSWECSEHYTYNVRQGCPLQPSQHYRRYSKGQSVCEWTEECTTCCICCVSIFSFFHYSFSFLYQGTNYFCETNLDFLSWNKARSWRIFSSCSLK